MYDQDKVRVLLGRPWQLANLNRTFEILVDGVRRTCIKNGKMMMLALPLGEHEIVARIDWCRSKPVMLRLYPDTEASVRIRCSVPWWAMLVPYLIFLYILVPGWYLEVELE